jgi:hypothetical protein
MATFLFDLLHGSSRLRAHFMSACSVVCIKRSPSPAIAIVRKPDSTNSIIKARCIVACCRPELHKASSHVTDSHFCMFCSNSSAHTCLNSVKWRHSLLTMSSRHTAYPYPMRCSSLRLPYQLWSSPGLYKYRLSFEIKWTNLARSFIPSRSSLSS